MLRHVRGILIDWCVAWGGSSRAAAPGRGESGPWWQCVWRSLSAVPNTSMCLRQLWAAAGSPHRRAFVVPACWLQLGSLTFAGGHSEHQIVLPHRSNTCRGRQSKRFPSIHGCLRHSAMAGRRERAEDFARFKQYDYKAVSGRGGVWPATARRACAPALPGAPAALCWRSSCSGWTASCLGRPGSDGVRSSTPIAGQSAALFEFASHRRTLPGICSGLG